MTGFSNLLAGAQRRVGAIARVHQHDAGRDARRQRGADLGERDLRLGAKADRLGNMGFIAARRIFRPVLW